MKSIKVRVTERITELREFTFEELGFEETETPSSKEIQDAIKNYVECPGYGFEATVDCEKVEFLS